MEYSACSFVVSKEPIKILTRKIADALYVKKDGEQKEKGGQKRTEQTRDREEKPEKV